MKCKVFDHKSAARALKRCLVVIEKQQDFYEKERKKWEEDAKELAHLRTVFRGLPKKFPITKEQAPDNYELIQEIWDKLI